MGGVAKSGSLGEGWQWQTGLGPGSGRAERKSGWRPNWKVECSEFTDGLD